MRSSFTLAATALVGIAAASPPPGWSMNITETINFPTASSSSSISSSTSTSYAKGLVVPSSSYISSSTSTSYAKGLVVPSSSSISSSTSTSYYYGFIPLTTTQSETVFTTTTVCPVTSTGITGSSVYTSTYLTTSTITITSCKGGCSATSTPTPVSPPSNATYDACTQAFYACETAVPYINHAFCASQYANCLGYNPFTTTNSDSVPTPTPAPVNSTSIPAPSSSSRIISSSMTSFYRGVPASSARSSSSTSTSYAMGLVIPTPTPAPANSTVDSCSQSYLVCIAQPGINPAHCYDLYATCLGYYGPIPTPTPTSVNTTSIPISTPTPAPANSTSASCAMAYEACSTAQGGNAAYCASQYADCLGYNPGGYGPVPSPNVTYTTEVVTAYTTFCPAPTTITTNGQTYTVTSATTLTITDCPCTITKPVIPPTTTPAPSPVTGPASTFITTQYTTLTSFVPCSTPVSSSGSTTFYSTWLTVSYSTSSTVYTTSTPVVSPSSAASFNGWITSPVVAPVQPSTTSYAKGLVIPSSSAQTSTTSYAMGLVIPSSSAQPSTWGTSQPSTTVIAPTAGQTCPTTIVYQTVTVAPVVPAPTVCSSCHVETTTITLSNGYTTCLTITATPTPVSGMSTSTYVPGQSQSWSNAIWSGFANPTGYAQPSGTGYPILYRQ